MTEEPRYHGRPKPDNHEEFIGHIGELDLYFEPIEPERKSYLMIVVGPEHRARIYNYDVFKVADGGLVPEGPLDINPTPYEMCLIYAVAADKGWL